MILLDEAARIYWNPATLEFLLSGRFLVLVPNFGGTLDTIEWNEFGFVPYEDRRLMMYDCIVFPGIG